MTFLTNIKFDVVEAEEEVDMNSPANPIQALRKIISDRDSVHLDSHVYASMRSWEKCQKSPKPFAFVPI